MAIVLAGGDEPGGIATTAEIDIDTLEQRLRAHVRDAEAVVYAPELICAWATTAR